MVDTSSDVIINVTLEDGAWKDSFDKLLEPTRPVLRALNLIKKDVRASFNMNSSVENCSNDNCKEFLQTCKSPLGLPVIHTPQSLLYKTISTPVNNQSIKKPFRCPLSPIGAWKSIFSEKSSISELESTKLLKSSPVNPQIVIVDLDEDTELRKTVTITNKRGSQKKESAPIQRVKSQISTTKLKPKRKSRQKRVFFESTNESLHKKRSKIITQTRSIIGQRKSSKERPKSLLLPSGKWRKTLNVWRRTQIVQPQNRRSSNNVDSYNGGDSAINLSFGPVGHRKSIFLKPELQSEVCHALSKPAVTSVWQERVLKYCAQNVVLDFSNAYSIDQMTKCRKIGEGAYGEVFINDFGDISKNTVFKIIPIEGKDLINGEVQKTYEQILPEIVISLELSKLSDSRKCINSTCGFVGIRRVVCVKGKYPTYLLDLWTAYDDEKGSENDNPAILPSEQIFIVLELSYGGKDLESFVFSNAEQSYYALQQVILTLAVGEVSYQFEHRDLHWGNILIMNTAEKNMEFKLEQKTITMPTKGVKTTIIDYTLSRMNFEDCCFYNDLSNDQDLFTAEGDYQFNIYRMMRDVLKNDWETSEPKTNIFWISYLIQKMLEGVKYRSTRTKIHAVYINKLKQLEGIILDFDSSLDLAKYLFLGTR